MPRFNLIEQPQPFLGLLAAAGAWAVSHQVGSNNAFDSCPTGGVVTIVVSIIGLAISLGGGLYCSLSHRKSKGSGRGVVATVGALLSLIASFAIVLQIAAGLILPQCAA